MNNNSVLSFTAATITPTTITAAIIAGVLTVWPATVLAQPTSGTPDEFAGQSEPLRVVHVLDEPRHRTVYIGDQLRLLDVQINPGDTSLPHTHDSPILYSFISMANTPVDGRLVSVTRYADTPFTHRVGNDGPGLFRIIALTSFGEPVADGADRLPDGLTGAPEIENPWFRAWRLTLAAGEQHPLIRHDNPAFLVQVSPGEAHLQRGGITQELRQPGDWSVLPTGDGYTLHNLTTRPVTFTIKEARQPLP